MNRRRRIKLTRPRETTGLEMIRRADKPTYFMGSKLREIEANDNRYRVKARKLFLYLRGTISIGQQAQVHRVTGGAWVQAQVFVED